MKLTFSLTVLLLFSSSHLLTQVNGGQIEKLRDLYNLEKYEACLFKADKLSQGAKYERDPEPLLYMSMCFYKLHLKYKDDIDSEYHDALKESLKYALKFKFKDRTKTMYNQNLEYIETLELATVNEATYYASGKDYRKASMLISALNRFNTDKAFEYYKGVLYILTKNKSGQRLIDKSLEFFHANSDSISTDRSIGDGKLKAIEIAAMYHADHLKANELKDSVKSVLSTIHNTLPESEEITLYYNQVMDIKVDPRTKNGLTIIKTKDVSKLEDSTQPKESSDNGSNDANLPEEN